MIVEGGARALLAGLPVHEVFVTQRRTIGEGDFTLLANLTWTTGPSHVARVRPGPDSDADADSRWLATPVVGAVVVGLAAKHWVSYHLRMIHRVQVLDSTDVTVIAHAKVRPGDTLSCECELLNAAAESDNETGLLDIEERAFNQHDELVAVVRQRWRFRREANGQ